MKNVLLAIMTLCVLFLSTISIKEIIKEYMRVKKVKRKNIIDEFYENEKSDLTELENKN